MKQSGIEFKCLMIFECYLFILWLQSFILLLQCFFYCCFQMVLLPYRNRFTSWNFCPTTTTKLCTVILLNNTNQHIIVECIFHISQRKKEKRCDIHFSSALLSRRFVEQVFLQNLSLSLSTFLFLHPHSMVLPPPCYISGDGVFRVIRSDSFLPHTVLHVGIIIQSWSSLTWLMAI